MILLKAAALILFGGLAALGTWRMLDVRSDAALHRTLLQHQPQNPPLFDPVMVDGLPEPAQRYFRATIKPGTPLYTVARIEMQGDLGMGSLADPGYARMTASQTLAAPHGFIWQVSTNRSGLPVSGSDGFGPQGGFGRFWLLGIMPVARASGSPDIDRSAFGRFVAEAAFWTPAALLPQNGVTWEPVDASTARAIFRHRGLEQAVEITVDENGRPVSVVFPRWSNANPQERFQIQPFGGTLSAYRDFDGFLLPTRVEAGNHFGTDAYFAFFKADVTSIRFPPAP